MGTPPFWRGHREAPSFKWRRLFLAIIRTTRDYRTWGKVRAASTITHTGRIQVVSRASIAGTNFQCRKSAEPYLSRQAVEHRATETRGMILIELKLRT